MKISLSLISVGMIAAAASAGTVESIDSGMSATYKGVISAAQMDLIKNPTNKEAAYAVMYNTNNWGSPYVVGNRSTTVGAAGQQGWVQYGGATSSFKVNASSPVTATNSHTGTSFTMKGGTTSTAFYDIYLDTSAAYAAQAGPGQLLWLENDMYRGANSTLATAAPSIYAVAFDSTYAQCNSGFKFNSYTGAASGLGSFLNSSGVITFYGFTLPVTSTTNYAAAASNWTKQASSYNVDTGEVSWYLSADNGATYSAWSYGAGTSAAVAVAGRGAGEVDFYTANAATAVAQSTTWANSAQYTTLVPAPGAVALLGLAGIAARRRRA